MRYVAGHQLRSSPIEYLIDAETGCWIWQRSVNPTSGYGYVSQQPAHRVIYERHRGPIAPGKQIDHLCRNRACVNPDHLEVVTPAENSRRGRMAKLTETNVAAIRRSGKSHRELARRFGVNERTIRAVRDGATWQGVGA